MIQKAVLTINCKFTDTKYMSLFHLLAMPHPTCSGSERVQQSGNMLLRPGTNAVTYLRMYEASIYLLTCLRNLLSHIQILHMQRSGGEKVVCV
jgi:hypothetical protein